MIQLVAMAGSAGKLRVVYVTKNFPPLQRVSGTMQYVKYLCNALGKKCDLTVVALENVSARQRGNSRLQGNGGLRVVRVKAPIALHGAIAARKAGADVVLFGSGLSSLTGLCATLIAMRFLLPGKPIVLHQLTEFNKKMHSLFFRPLFPLVEKIVCVSSEIRRNFSAAGKKVVLIFPGVDLLAMPGKPVAKPKNVVRIGFFGHFHWLKGPDRLVQAFKELHLHNAELVFVGADYYKDGTSERILSESRGMKNVRVFGPREDFLQLMLSCDFVALPFRSSGSVLGISMAAMEAMALGKPVIASDASVFEDLVKNGENGLVAANDKELKKAIELLYKDKDLRQAMGKRAADTIRKKFEINKQAGLLLRLCSAVARK